MDHNDVTQIEELFMGRRIVAAEKLDPPQEMGWYRNATGVLTLDDGRKVYVVPNIGGCSCGAGDYELTALNRVDNIITRVDVIREDVGGEWYDVQSTYKIFVLAGHEQINAMIVEGDDGNGYYGTGFELIVVEP